MAPRLLYCHCAYARVVPPETKTAVLEALSRAGVEFDAVPDLCEMAARGDARLRELGASGPLRIAACYPRAVRWLFASAGQELAADTVIANMRTQSANQALQELFASSDPMPQSEPGATE
jgi:hypothetical protein